MAKKIAVKKIEPVEFEDLHRGTSVTIPVVIKKKEKAIANKFFITVLSNKK